MLDVSGYGCLAARAQGERHWASSYKFVNVYFPSCYIPLYLVSHDSSGSPDCTLLCMCVCVLTFTTYWAPFSNILLANWGHVINVGTFCCFKGLFEG